LIRAQARGLAVTVVRLGQGQQIAQGCRVAVQDESAAGEAKTLAARTIFRAD
jgi:hypothetical protein